jgi:hypothetical protein
VHRQLVLRHVVDLNAERTHRVDRRLRVAGAEEAAYVRLPLAERAEQNGAVRDRFVAGHCDVPADFGRRLYF